MKRIVKTPRPLPDDLVSEKPLNPLPIVEISLPRPLPNGTTKEMIE